MRLGAVFPQVKEAVAPSFLRDYIQAVEALGYDHLLLYEHVLGADPNRPGWSGHYTHEDPFHEPFVFLAWTAAHTQRLGLVTAVLVLPQRQTALVAKQAAELDLLSGGRLRLGVGIGWNEVEYEALGMDFPTRGRRMDAQIQLLRRLWSEPIVDIHDRWHTISRAGINPRPPRPIPVWVGGMSDAALRRAARLGDGWLPMSLPMEEARAMVARLHDYLRAERRDPAAFGIEGRINISGSDLDRQVEAARQWQELGAQYLAVTAGRAQLPLSEHVAILRRFKEAWEAAQPAVPTR